MSTTVSPVPTYESDEASDATVASTPRSTRSARTTSTAQASLSTPRPTQTAALQVLSEETQAGGTGASSTAGQGRVVSRIDLSPSAAARSVFDSHAPVLAPATSQHAHAGSEPTGAELARQVPGLAEYGRSTTEQRASEAVHRGITDTLRPWDIVLKPMAGGRFHYYGRGFDAVIHSDGHVTYRELQGLYLSPARIIALDGSHTSGVGMGIHNPGALLEQKAGNDPNGLERHAFLDETRALREQLLKQTESSATRRALPKLNLTLLHLWAKPGLTNAQRLDAIFALWDACAEEGPGAEARAQISSFVRAHCVVATACGLGPQELLRVNRTRRSHQPFDPYLVADGGTQ